MATLPYPAVNLRIEAPSSGGPTDVEPPQIPFLIGGLLVAVTDQSVLRLDQTAGTNGLRLLASSWIPSSDDTRTAGVFFADASGRRFRMRLETADPSYQQVLINGTPVYRNTKDLLHRIREPRA